MVTAHNVAVHAGALWSRFDVDRCGLKVSAETETETECLLPDVCVIAACADMFVGRTTVQCTPHPPPIHAPRMHLP